MNIQQYLKKYIKEKNIPDFWPGDDLRIEMKVQEGGQEKTTVFEGIVIRKRGEGINKTFTLRKVSFGVGVEKTIPLYSPNILKIEILKKGDFRRAKLYYLRKRK